MKLDFSPSLDDDVEVMTLFQPSRRLAPLLFALGLGVAACSSGTPAGGYSAPPDPASLGDASVVEISNGGEVEIEPYLVDGVRTIVEFGAVW